MEWDEGTVSTGSAPPPPPRIGLLGDGSLPGQHQLVRGTIGHPDWASCSRSFHTSSHLNSEDSLFSLASDQLTFKSIWCISMCDACVCMCMYVCECVFYCPSLVLFYLPCRTICWCEPGPAQGSSMLKWRVCLCPLPSLLEENQYKWYKNFTLADKSGFLETSKMFWRKPKLYLLWSPALCCWQPGYSEF